jgi:NTE family protein
MTPDIQQVDEKQQAAGSGTRPKVGVVVGSGGIKALASIPLFEFLEQANIKVDLLVGCSGGSILAALWAVCGSAAEMREGAPDLWTRKLFSKVNRRAVLSMAGLPFGRFDKSKGLVKSDEILATNARMYGDTLLEDLPIKTILQATDLMTGEPVLLTKGLVREAVYASGALFPILPAYCIEDRWLIDGAFSSPLPVMQAIMEGMDVIIAHTNEEKNEKEEEGILPYLMRCLYFSTFWLQRNQTALCVDMHHHEIIFINVAFDRPIGLRATHRIPQILQAGEEAVEEKKAEIFRAIESFAPSRAPG